jgi:hypothetical protein
MDLILEERKRKRVHDAFIVRYDAECGMPLSLPEHSGTSITLQYHSISRDKILKEVGLGFEFIAEEQDDDSLQDDEEVPAHAGLVVNADRGQAVAFAGPLRHARVSRDKRMSYHFGSLLVCRGFCLRKMLESACGRTWSALRDFWKQHAWQQTCEGN